MSKASSENNMGFGTVCIQAAAKHKPFAALAVAAADKHLMEGDFQKKGFATACTDAVLKVKRQEPEDKSLLNICVEAAAELVPSAVLALGAAVKLLEENKPQKKGLATVCLEGVANEYPDALRAVGEGLKYLTGENHVSQKRKDLVQNKSKPMKSSTSNHQEQRNPIQRTDQVQNKGKAAKPSTNNHTAQSNPNQRKDQVQNKGKAVKPATSNHQEQRNPIQRMDQAQNKGKAGKPSTSNHKEQSNPNQRKDQVQNKGKPVISNKKKQIQSTDMNMAARHQQGRRH